ncbi:CbbQ/NirQ/NorQ C-terminal domain-containing protein [Methanolobus sp. ZRKC5]
MIAKCSLLREACWIAITRAITDNLDLQKSIEEIINAIVE